MKLNEVNIKINKKKIRPGRGIGSGKGKTCGRGHKGQKSRSGVAIKSFEGGQMPLYRRLPKRGFKSKSKTKEESTIINLSFIDNLLNSKIISESEKINLSLLQNKNIINKKYKKLKILGKGDINKKINVQINKISAKAKLKIEKKGGLVSLIEKKKTHI